MNTVFHFEDIRLASFKLDYNKSKIYMISPKITTKKLALKRTET